MTENIEKEIKEYIDNQGWGFPSGYLFRDNMMCPSYFFFSNKGVKNEFERKWKENEEGMDKYMLEYIGHILRKYNIKTINVWYRCTYQSDTWKFNDIKKIK